MKFMEEAKFQSPDTATCRQAWIAWDAGELKILYVAAVADSGPIQVDVEVAQKGADGIFRRAEEFNFDEQTADILRALRDTAKAINSP